MSAAHIHAPPRHARSRMSKVIGITLFVVAVELAVGLHYDSLAVLSDAGHNAADMIAFICSWYALWISEKSADTKHTFGYHRSGILAAFFNALVLVVMALTIWWEAYDRLRHPVPVAGTVIALTALVSLIMNLINSYLLYEVSKNELNIHSALIHALGDAVTAFGIVIAGIVIAVTGNHSVDPLISVAVGGIILWSAIRLLKESTGILMEAVPGHISMHAVEQAVLGTPGVLGVHDLHVWAIASRHTVCTFHVVVSPEAFADGEIILRALSEKLTHQFGIKHTTIQIEQEGWNHEPEVHLEYS
jgi:cobalt-zinc-cadmium efflux system protein